jgi:hypothetical protein
VDNKDFLQGLKKNFTIEVSGKLILVKFFKEKELIGDRY